MLEAQGVAKLVMESRFPAADTKDASHFRTMVRRGLVDSIELGFANSAVEHRLWIPDQILSAYAESVTSPGLPKAWESEWEALRGTVTTTTSPCKQRRSQLPRTLGYTGSDFLDPLGSSIRLHPTRLVGECTIAASAWTSLP